MNTVDFWTVLYNFCQSVMEGNGVGGRQPIITEKHLKNKMITSCFLSCIITEQIRLFSIGWYHKQRLGTHWLSAVLSFLVQSPQQNGCMGAYRVIDLEQFPIRIPTDKAPIPLTKFGICSFFFFFFCHSPFFFFSFFLLFPFSFFSSFFHLFFFFFPVSPCQIHSVSVRLSWDDPCLHNNNKLY